MKTAPHPRIVPNDTKWLTISLETNCCDIGTEKAGSTSLPTKGGVQRMESEIKPSDLRSVLEPAMAAHPCHWNKIYSNAYFRGKQNKKMPHVKNPKTENSRKKIHNKEAKQNKKTNNKHKKHS